MKIRDMSQRAALLGQDLKTGAILTPSDYPAINFAKYAARARPAPASADWGEPADRKGWTMMGNSRYGCCTMSSLGHAVMVFSFYGRKQLIVPPESEVIDRYLRLTNGQDVGLAVGPALYDWVQNPMTGDRLTAYAKIDYKDLNAVKLAIAEFGCVILVFMCPPKMFEEFYAGKTWTDWSGQPFAAHAIPVVKYGPDSAQCITWGCEQDFTWDWYQHCVCEAHVPLGDDWDTPVTPSGIELAQLLADFNELQGLPPSPEPPPTPAPVLLGLNPNAGTPGTNVLLTGKNLLGVKVYFGTTEAQKGTPDPDGTWLNVLAPSLPTGSYDVRAVAPNGSQAVLGGGFFMLGSPTPVPPRITRIVPPSGPVGTAIVIEGTGFTTGTAVTIAGKPATSTLVGQTIQSVIPTGLGGTSTTSVVVRVANSNGSGNFIFVVTPVGVTYNVLGGKLTLDAAGTPSGTIVLDK